MAAVTTWRQLEHPTTEVYARIETFEREQQRQFLTQLLAKPSALYRQAVAAGLTPAAFRLECWKVRRCLPPGYFTYTCYLSC